MKRYTRLSLLSLAAIAVGSAVVAQDATWEPLSRHRKTNPLASAEYIETIRKTANMVGDHAIYKTAGKYGLNVLNVTWEDTGRYKGSSVGPNISDMTIQVGAKDPRTGQFQVTCMPVIRYPNFSDVTCDIDPRDFTLLVGNQSGWNLKRTSLYDFLAQPTNYLSKPGSWLGKNKSLLAGRDSKVLVSAQACFLPIPKQGIATFNPVVFNYQSVSGDPAVLTILATREGTSTTIIDNKRDAFAAGSVWGQRLFHNQKGMRASLTGERLSDFRAKGGGGKGKDSNLNMVLLIQVPLKQKRPMRAGNDSSIQTMEAPGAGGGGAYKSKSGRSDVEAAVIGHGDVEGPFTEIDNLAVQRDDRFPVRVTVQFYKATSNGIASDADIAEIKREIEHVYSFGDSVGSLVTEGETGRVTEYDGVKVQPPYWWQEFWQRHEQNTGDSRWEAIAKLKKLLGQNYMQRPVCELYVRDLLRKK